MHISRILKTEDKKIKKNHDRGLNFEDIANSTVCYLGAGIEFQCSEHKIGYEAFKGCDKLQAITIGTTNKISIPYSEIDKLIKGEKITI
jgi:CO dehydrogenase/acetyl-CoA synthase delta subunit